jgi:hypothetical protein
MDGNAPTLGVNLYPVPTAAHSLVAYSLKPLTALAAADTLSLPPGYTRAIRYNLAMELAPEYGKQVDQILMGIASEAKADLKRSNIETILATSDAIMINQQSVFNITLGE